MTHSVLQVQMFGNFSLEYEGHTIDQRENRSRKVWLLLAYLIYCRSRRQSGDDMIRLLWEDDSQSSNPSNAMKTMLHRVRTQLNQLWPDAGHELILHRNGAYTWNTEIPIICDVDEFNRLCQEGRFAQGETRLTLFLQALNLYQGDFLPKLAMESWVLPISAYYHQLYLDTAIEASQLLTEANRWADTVSLCRKALRIEPYSEELCQCLMRSLLALNQRKAAAVAYEELSERLFQNFGVLPSEETRSLYREAIRSVTGQAFSFANLRDQLRESKPAKGALLCDYDFFKILYQAEARLIARSGDTYHVALLSVVGKDGKELPKRSMAHIMENLQELVRVNLRLGDIAALCSASQFILMLPQANYENSCMVCDRVIRSFFRQYPHAPAEIRYHIEPLEPCLL